VGKFSDGVDGGLSWVLHLHRHGSEDRGSGNVIQIVEDLDNITNNYFKKAFTRSESYPNQKIKNTTNKREY
jgi:hypothetical protein